MTKITSENIQTFLSAYYKKDALPDRSTFHKIFKDDLKANPGLIDIDDLCRKMKTSKIKRTILDAACEEGYADFVKCLLKKGVDPNQCNDSRYTRYAIHTAQETNHMDIVFILLNDSRTDPNCQNKDGETILYNAVKNEKIDQIEAFLSYDKVDVNIPDVKRYRPIQLATLNSNFEIIKIMLEKAGDKIDLSFVWNGKEILYDSLKRYPGLQLPKLSARTQLMYLLLKSLINHDEDSFISNFKMKFYMSQEDSENLILLCFQENRVKEFAEILRKSRQKNINITIKTWMLLAAVNGGSEEILKNLFELKDEFSIKIDQYDDSFSEWVEIVARLVDEDYPGLDKKIISGTKCLLLLLPGKNKSWVDGQGNTLLKTAVDYQNETMINELLSQGFYIHAKNIFNDSPLLKIRPGILSRCLDNRMVFSDRPENSKSESGILTIDHSFLDPYSGGKEGSRYDHRFEMTPLAYISKNTNFKHLLNHPVISSFVDRKWDRIRSLLFSNFIIYCFFHVFINLYAILSTYDQKAKLSFPVNSCFWILPIILSILTIFLLVRELVQFICSPLVYFKDFMNWIDLSIIGLVCFVISGIDISLNGELKVILIFFSTVKFVSLLGRYHSFVMPYLIFRTVVGHIAKGLILHLNFFWAFALGFFIMFSKKGSENSTSDNEPKGRFDEIWLSIFNTIVMATGEFNVNEIPFNSLLVDRVIFILFVFTIGITVLNLIAGFVIADVDTITKDAQKHCIKYKIDDILNVEKVYRNTILISADGLFVRIISSILNSRGSRDIFLFGHNESTESNHQIKIRLCNGQEWKNDNDYLDDKILSHIERILAERYSRTDKEKYDEMLEKLEKIAKSIEDKIHI